MPVLTEKTSLENLVTHQQKCKLCNEEATHSKYKTICDICQMWTCLDCSDLNEELYLLVERSNLKVNYVCNSCEEDLPKLREFMVIQQQQQQISEDVNKLKKDVTTNATAIDEQNKENTTIKQRLDRVEDILQRNDLTNPLFPTLPALKQDLSKQMQQTNNLSTLNQNLRKQITESRQEQLSMDTKKSNLIIYGIKETQATTINQMKADFTTIKQLYDGRVNINKEDFQTITRIGLKKPNQIRPIKITFVDMEQRKRVLINNQGLKLDEEGANTCEFTDCSEYPTKHTHIYISTDKTKKEIEVEKQLRQELKTRRDAGEQDIKIKYGKIVKTTEEKTVQPRWADVSADEW